jgi:FkbM family methyltransferase
MKKNEIKKLLGKENPIIFEIGCADGKDTTEFLNTFNDLTIYCFEPEPTNINIVKNTINHKSHFLFEGVVSDKNGKVIFNRSRTNNPKSLRYSGSIKQPKEHLNEWPNIKFDETMTITSITLDKFCEDNKINKIDFIWADVQGAEKEMINGGKNILKNVKFLYTEYSNKEYYEGQSNLNQIKSILGDSWEIVKDFGTDVLFKNKNFID